MGKKASASDVDKTKEEELQKANEAETAAAEDESDSGEDLEKALDEALAGVELRKAKKAAVEDEDEPEEEGSEEDEDEEEEYSPPPRKAKKSMDDDDTDYEGLSKSVAEELDSDEDASKVINAVPFVKALVDTLDDQVTELIKAIVSVNDRVGSLTKKVSALEGSLEKSKNLDVASAKMLKSIHGELRAFGDAPQPRQSVLSTKGLIIMNKSSNAKNVTPLSKSQALDKIGVLFRNGKLDLTTATVAESRIQKGIPLAPEVEALLTANG